MAIHSLLMRPFGPHFFVAVLSDLLACALQQQSLAPLPRYHAYR